MKHSFWTAAHTCRRSCWTSPLHPSWQQVLSEELAAPYMRQLRAFLVERNHAGAKIYPPAKEMFAAFEHTPLDEIRAVIVGQDPYCYRGQAHGLCFSVRPGVTVPPSLRNIFAELQSDLGLSPPDHGCLLPWSRSGVLLLNSVLSVEEGRPGSHASQGWEAFTETVLNLLNARPGLVFLLWGNYARQRAEHLDRARHLVLEAAHPSPRSADRGFFGCRHFSQCNDWLRQQQMQPVGWELPAAADLPQV